MLSIPAGYFIYDFFDMVLNQKLSQSWELLFHHVVVGLSNITVTAKKKNPKNSKKCFIMFHQNLSTPVRNPDMGKTKYSSFELQRTHETGTKTQSFQCHRAPPPSRLLPPSIQRKLNSARLLSSLAITTVSSLPQLSS